MFAVGDPWAAATYLASQFVAAVNDLPTVPVVDLYARFLLSVPLRARRGGGAGPSARRSRRRGGGLRDSS